MTPLKRKYSVMRNPVHLPKKILMGRVRIITQGWAIKSLIKAGQLAR